MKTDPTNFLAIDFGSGHNPAEGFKTCDCTGNPMLDFHFDCENYEFLDAAPDSVDLLRCRNVIHHVPDLLKLFKAFHTVLKPDGKLVIIEPNEASYRVSFGLDVLWYRAVCNRPEVWFAREYRDYTKVLREVFPFVSRCVGQIYEVTIVKKLLTSPQPSARIIMLNESEVTT